MQHKKQDKLEKENKYLKISQISNNIAQITFFVILAISIHKIIYIIQNTIIKDKFRRDILDIIMGIRDPRLKEYAQCMAEQNKIFFSDSQRVVFLQQITKVQEYDAIICKQREAEKIIEKIPAGQRFALENRSAMLQALENLRIINCDEGQYQTITYSILQQIDECISNKQIIKFSEIPEVKHIIEEMNADLNGIERHIDDFINVIYFQYIVKIYLVFRPDLQGQFAKKQPNFTLIGDPGTGKSRLQQNFNKYTGADMSEFFGFNLDEFSFSGRAKSEQVALKIGTLREGEQQPSIFVQSLLRRKSLINFVFIDEFDKIETKIKQPTLSICLYQLLPVLNGADDRQNKEFKDNFFPPLNCRQITFDISKTIIIFAMNKPKKMFKSSQTGSFEALLSRLTMLKFTQPTHFQQYMFIVKLIERILKIKLQGNPGIAAAADTLKQLGRLMELNHTIRTQQFVSFDSFLQFCQEYGQDIAERRECESIKQNQIFVNRLFLSGPSDYDQPYYQAFAKIIAAEYNALFLRACEEVESQIPEGQEQLCVKYAAKLVRLFLVFVVYGGCMVQLKFWYRFIGFNLFDLITSSSSNFGELAANLRDSEQPDISSAILKQLRGFYSRGILIFIENKKKAMQDGAPIRKQNKILRCRQFTQDMFVHLASVNPLAISIDPQTIVEDKSVQQFLTAQFRGFT